jgi:hypothetical protein
MVEELHVATIGLGGAEEPLRVLEHLRQLPYLRELTIKGEPGHAREVAAAFPPFIPPSLKTLTLNFHQAPLLESLLRQLPSMLEASGAGLEDIKFSLYEPFAGCGAALARVLHTCSSTLKTLHIVGEGPDRRMWDPAFASEVAPGLMSCCEGLERLEVPSGVFESLPPTCPTFKRLTFLHLTNPNWGIDLSSPVWDRVGSGLLPALADLSLCCQRLWWVREGEGEGGFCLLTRALEAVAGTLRRLALRSARLPKIPPVTACHELGWRSASYGASAICRYACATMAGATRPWGGAWRPRGAAHRCSSYTWPEPFEISIVSFTSPP